MKKKLLAILLTVCMVLSMAPAALAAEFGDTDGHWAEGSIERWADYGIIEGVGDGEFNPDGTMTRAQAAAIFARLLKLDAKADISKYTDVDSDAWYAEYIAMCVAAGIMNGVGDGKMDPDGTLTREQMMVMLCRALGIEPEETCDKTFDDSDKVSDWAEGYVNALVNAGIVDGVGGNTMAPNTNINRASMMALLDKSIAGYADEDGETLTVEEGKTGVILVVADKVKVEDAPAGTTVVTGADAHDTTVNGTEISNDTVHEVPEDEEPVTPPVVGPSVPSHTHSYTYTSNEDGTHEKICSCATTTEDCDEGTCSKCGYIDGAEAKIGDTYYATLAEAVAEGDNTIVLLKEVTLTETLTFAAGKTVTLDLNGKTVSGNFDKSVGHVLYNNGTLTIKNGTLASKAENGGSAVANAAGATLTLENVTLLGAPQGEHDNITAANAAYPSYAINNWGELTVNTATIKTYHGAVATGAGGNVVLDDVTIDVGQNTTTNITSWALYAYGSADEIGKITINSGNVKMTKVEPSVNGGGYACTGDGGQITIKGGSFDKAGPENNGNGIHVKANSLVITGGTFDTDPSAYVADGYKAVEADGVWTVSERLTGEVINAAEAQAALDNATPGTVIQLSEGVAYGTLVFRQNASSVVVDITDAGGDAAGNEHYSRYEDITIIGAEGATVDQIDFEVGWIPGSGASYVDIENLTVQGVTFSGNNLAVNLEGSKGSALGIDGLTLVDCKMKDTDGTHRFVFQQITGYKALNDKTTSEYVMTAGVKNLTITDCEIEDAYMVIESRAMENLTITNNIFKGIKERDMLITSDTTNHAGVTYTGTITITGNASSGGEERFIRASLNNSNAVVVIKDNTITNYKGEDADYIKVTDSTGTPTIENNTLVSVGSAAAAQAMLDAATDGTVIQLAEGVDYGTLYIRANPGHSNTTLEDIADAWAYNYNRSIENVTILGATGAKLDGIIFETGAQPGDCNNRVTVKNLVIDGIEFTDALTASATGYNAPIMITTSNATIDGLTVKNCKLIGNNSKLNLVYLYGADGSKNVTLTGNTVDGIARLCELRGTENVTITGNTIKNTYEHGMLLTGSGYSGNITITGNNADSIAMRFVRMAGAGAANVVITDNTITNYLASDADYIKVTDSTGTPTIENNTLVSVGSAAAAQAMLDAAVPSTTIQLAKDVNYGVLYLRPVADSPATKEVDWQGNNYHWETYTCFENLTIKGAEGATVDAIVIEGGTYYNTEHSQKDEYTVMLSLVELKNVTIEGVTFTGKGGYDPQGHGNVINLSGNNIKVDGLTLKNCVLNDENDAGKEARLIYKTESTTQLHTYTYGGDTYTFYPTLKDITVTGCTITGGYMGLELRETENVTITNNTFSNMTSRNILLPTNSGYTYSGTVTITGNTVNDAVERFVRADQIGNATLIITGNTINNYMSSDLDYIKATGVTGTYTVENNTITDGTDGNRSFAVTVE